MSTGNDDIELQWYRILMNFCLEGTENYKRFMFQEQWHNKLPEYQIPFIIFDWQHSKNKFQLKVNQIIFQRHGFDGNSIF